MRNDAMVLIDCDAFKVHLLEASRLEITRSASVLCSSTFTLSSAFLASQTWLRLG